MSGEFEVILGAERRAWRRSAAQLTAVAVVRRYIALEAACNILQALSGAQPEGTVNLPRPAVQAAS